MTGAADTGAGRPLRVTLLLGLGLGVWVMLRLPLLERDAALAQGALRGDPPSSPEAGFQLASTQPIDRRTGTPNDLAIAEAEVGVARARLALAEAQLLLVRAQHGGGYAAPAGAAPANLASAAPSPNGYAGAPPPRRRDSFAHAAAAPIPDYRYEMPRARPVNARSSRIETVAAAPLQTPPSPALPGHDLATAAYARLAAGDRREAVRLFDAALATPPGPIENPDRLAWAAERRRLMKRWSGEVYSLVRDGGAVGPTASPVLGGGQTGAIVSWTIDPLARRPVALVARFNSAADRNGAPDNRSNQAAVGVRWQPVKGISLTGERLIRVGEFARNDWNLRLAAGADGKRGRIEWNAYGEAGILGAGDVYAGAQARAAVPIVKLQKTRLLGGAGAWGSVQNSAGFALGRFDVGPTLLMRTPVGRTTIDLSADYRFRLVGGAQPGNGPAITLSTGF